MQIIGISIAIIALLISVVTAIIAGLALKEQVRITKLTANYTAITTADSLLVNHPELLDLYNIDKALMEASGIKPIELLYLAESFHAAELYHRIDGRQPIIISDYRKNLLRNKKVRKAWQSFIRHKFIFNAPFTKAVDEFIEKEEDASARQA